VKSADETILEHFFCALHARLSYLASGLAPEQLSWLGLIDSLIKQTHHLHLQCRIKIGRAVSFSKIDTAGVWDEAEESECWEKRWFYFGPTFLAARLTCSKFFTHQEIGRDRLALGAFSFISGIKEDSFHPVL
jgi:hypothetical protein